MSDVKRTETTEIVDAPAKDKDKTTVTDETVVENDKPVEHSITIERERES